MSDVQINPRSKVLTCGIAAGATASTPLNLFGWRTARVQLPPSFVATGMRFSGATAGPDSAAPATTLTSAYRPIRDSAGTLASVAAAAKASVELPSTVMAAGWVRIVAGTKQTTTAGAAPISVLVKNY